MHVSRMRSALRITIQGKELSLADLPVCYIEPTEKLSTAPRWMSEISGLSTLYPFKEVVC